MSIANLNSSELDLEVKSLTLENPLSNKTLSIYKEYTLDYVATGPFPTGINRVATIVQMDNRITITFPGIISATTIATTTITLVPAVPFPKPARDIYFPVVIYSTNVNNATNLMGYGIVNSVSGVITINTILPTTTFFDVAGYPSFCLSYSLV